MRFGQGTRIGQTPSKYVVLLEDAGRLPPPFQQFIHVQGMDGFVLNSAYLPGLRINKLFTVNL
jgi:hypothetical protein